MSCSVAQYRAAMILTLFGMGVSVGAESPGSALVFFVLLIVLCVSQINILSDKRTEIHGNIV